ATRVDQYVVNSKFVAERVRRYYGRNSVVVNPPCVNTVGEAPIQKRDEFYLVFGAFVPYKRLDLAIQACKSLNRRLIVAGQGPELKKLKTLAENSNHIEFIERPSNDQSKRLFETAKALIFPGIEDFGIVPVEAQERQCPVIALGHGGALETVVHLKTGYLFEQQTVESLTNAILEFEKLTFKSADFKKNVSRFSTDRFKTEISRLIQQLDSTRKA
ncbi:MAG: glycosyltransferase, partial [Leptonema sp. (in: Bacteria)]|nr:glycosyltransferase [Leptonema sp. (in: bacteria)]